LARNPEELERAIKALNHYHAYVVAVQREDFGYQRLAEKLERARQ
jgi:hypothetical protein